MALVNVRGDRDAGSNNGGVGRTSWRRGRQVGEGCGRRRLFSCRLGETPRGGAARTRVDTRGEVATMCSDGAMEHGGARVQQVQMECNKRATSVCSTPSCHACVAVRSD